MQAASGPGFEDLQWLVVEWSELSSRMLQALRSDLAVYNGPFERWVRERGPEYRGRLGLVLANPPYGARGASVTEDPDREYREKAAYAYFLRRGLDLLAPNGLGVYLVPGGFLTGRAMEVLGPKSPRTTNGPGSARSEVSIGRTRLVKMCEGPVIEIRTPVRLVTEQTSDRCPMTSRVEGAR